MLGGMVKFEELAKCPSCGSDAIIREGKDTDYTYVMCERVNCMQTFIGLRDEVINVWNACDPLGGL